MRTYLLPFCLFTVMSFNIVEAQPLANHVFYDADSNVVDLYSLGGTATILTCWDDWASPSVRLLEELQVVHDNYAPYGLSVIGYYLNRNENATEEFEEQLGNGITFMMVFDTTSVFDSLYSSILGLRSIPTTFFLDTTFDVFEVFVGWRPDSFFVERLLEHWTPLGMDNEYHALPRVLTLSVYPNPFNSSATLKFDLPREMRVEIELFDLLGRSALKLSDNVFAAGTHSLAIDAASLASGVYFAHLRTVDFSTTQKLLLLR